jgi:hypothetical protein
MHTQTLIRHMLAPLALASLLSAAPALAPSGGGGQGRWLQATERTTLLHGYLDDGAGVHAFHIEAMLTATTPSRGGVYGSLDEMPAQPVDALRQKEFFLYGQYARSSDGRGKFDAVVLMQLSGSGLPIVLAVGTVRGALSPAIRGDQPIAVPIDLDGDGSDALKAVYAPIEDATLAFKAKLATHIARLERARNMVRAILSRAGALPNTVVDDIGMTAQRKGSFRARWSVR